MELRHLRYFVAVASELHFARAAQRLFISQPALSQQLRSLEGELGLKLLERNRRGVRLTPEGEAFLAEASAVVQRADRAVEVARALAEGASGKLRMSYVRTMPGGLPERVVSEYQRRFPRVELTAESGSTVQNVERLQAGELDVAFVHTPFEHADDLGRVDIATEPLVIALPSTHPLSRRRRMPREALADVPLVYFPRRSSPGVYDHSLSQVYGSSPPDIVRTEPTEERILVAVAEGVGITLLVEERAVTLRYPGVTFRRFAEPEPTVALGLAFRQPPSLAARRFIDLAQELGRKPRLVDRPRL
ncbi:MAG: LysR family transcriptional regulator [Chloroflexi bacterium]|nr:LysR family transcriptional regulator [Chloroflexota bacterium]